MLDCGIWTKGLQMKRTQPARSRHESGRTEPMLEKARLTTVIASTPGIGEQSLRATLEAFPSVQVVGTAAGCLTALQMVRERQADLVVIDSNLPIEDVRVLLRQLQEEEPETRSLVLAATSGQVRQALAAGADSALRRDASIRQLGAVVAEFYHANTVETPEPDDEISQGI
jgi:DNA-binding NarL/FixJ family response regulator